MRNQNEHPRNWAVALPPSPQILFGRDAETTAIVAALASDHDKPVHLAVLGAPGIGKTSVALRAAHDPLIVGEFGERRVFVQCDSAVSGGALLSLLGNALGARQKALRKLRAEVTSILADRPTLLILDNFESPWEPSTSRAETEELLACLCSVERLAIIVTMRGTERPGCVQWTRPFLPPLGNLSRHSARQTFLAISDICEEHPDLERLLDAMDGVPLAITLAANLAQYEPCDRLFIQWTGLDTAILDRGNSSRLSSLDASIELSMLSSRMLSVPEAPALLSLLALLPEGINVKDVPAMAPSFSAISRGISALLQTALVYKPKPDHIRVLAPIRAFVLARHPPTASILTDYHRHIVAETELMHVSGRTSGANLLPAMILNNAANYESVLVHALERGLHLEQTIHALASLVSTVSAHYSVSLGCLRLAADKARLANLPALQSKCLRGISTISSWQDPQFDALPGLRIALALATQALDTTEQIQCLLDLSHPGTTAADLLECHEHASMALSLAKQSNAVSQSARALRRLGEIEYLRGTLSEARQHLEEGLQLVSAADAVDPYHVYYSKKLLAEIAGCSGDLKSACAILEEVIAAAEELELFLAVMSCRRRIGYLHLQRSDISKAIKELESGMALERQLQLHSSMMAVVHLVEAHIAMDDPARATAVLNQVQDVVSRSDANQSLERSPYNSAHLAWARGHISTHMEHFDTARAHYHHALNYFTKSLPGNVPDLLFYVGDTWRLQGEHTVARNVYVLSAVMNWKFEERQCLLYTLGNMADTFLTDGDLSTAFALTMAVLAWIAWSDMKRRTADCYVRLARISSARGDMKKAAAQLVKAHDLYSLGCDGRGVAQCRRLQHMYCI